MILISYGVLLAGCSSGAGAIHAKPEQLVLRLQQIPYPGFETFGSASGTGEVSNQRAANGNRTLLNQLRAEGRIAGYAIAYQRLASPQAAIGPILIESSAATYRSGAGATAGFRLQERRNLTAGWRLVSAGHLGEQAVAFQQLRQSQQTSYEALIVEWREINVVNSVEVEGSAATLDLNYALTLARIQQRGEAARR